jgi:hypothetical protein
MTSSEVNSGESPVFFPRTILSLFRTSRAFLRANFFSVLVICRSFHDLWVLTILELPNVEALGGIRVVTLLHDSLVMKVVLDKNRLFRIPRHKLSPLLPLQQ